MVDPVSGEIRDPQRTSVSRIPSSGGTGLDQLMEALSEHSDDLEAALIEEERCELAFHFAESVAMIKYADDLAATILPKYVKAQCNAELAAWTAAQFARKRAWARVKQTTDLLTAEQSRLKHFGVADGGNR